MAFSNGQELVLEAATGLVHRKDANGSRLEARLSLEDYVARVVDREGRAQETEAARALAIAARSYVLQNATESDACRLIADDSRTQRVSPRTATAAARAAAAFTEGLVVTGVPVRYHRDRASPGVMSWQASVETARQGVGFEALLLKAYPGGQLGGARAQADCEPLPEATNWLAQRQLRWRALLRTQPGYEAVAPDLSVCALLMGVPHADQRRLVIRVREWNSREGRVALIHEYLHLAFRQHPNGQNEAFIEQWAQRLADS